MATPGWRSVLRGLVLGWLALGCGPVWAEEGVMVQVLLQGESVVVDALFSVTASRAEVWEVLTDFDHMAAFVSNLAVSRVVAREGQTLRVFQRGEARRGPFHFPFESLREIRLEAPGRITTHLVSGTPKGLEGVTEITSDGPRTRVSYHGESVPDVWIPPVVGRGFIADEVREQFEEMRREILRRHRLAPVGLVALPG